MSDEINEEAPTVIEDLSVEHRIYLGRIQPWGNPSYLAALMGSTSPVVPLAKGMPKSTFKCPVCRGAATATASATVGSLKVTCEDSQCDSDKLTTICRIKAPMAFSYREDLIPPIAAEVRASLIARATEGVFAAGIGDAMRILDKVRDGTTPQVYDITGPAGEVVALQFCFAKGKGEERTKSFLPFHCERDAHGAINVVAGLPSAPWPVFNWAELAERPEAPVLVTEGEKTATAASELFPDYVSTTSLCGAGNPHNTDWSPLRGRTVVILPDNDDAGRDYAVSVAAQVLASRAASARIVKLPDGLPKGWDIADPAPDGFDMASIHHAITSAPEVTWDAVKHGLRQPREERAWPPFRLPDGHFAKRKAVVREMKEGLAKIDSGCHRRSWLRVLRGLHHAFGTEVGLPMAVEWSKRDHAKHGKFREGEVERLFEGFDLAPAPNPVSLNALRWQAYRESAAAEAGDRKGWQPSDDVIRALEVGEFEARHRKLRQGSNVYVAIQNRRSDGTYEVELIDEKSAKSVYMSKRVPASDRKGTGTISIFNAWETSQRIPPLKVVFRPNETVAADEFNLFQGFEIKPKAGGSYAAFKDLIDRWTRENELPDDYLWNLLAYRIKNPDKFVPVCMVIIGPQGGFKSTFTGVIHKLVSPYSISISDAENLAGRNNGVLQGKLFIQAEEIAIRGDDQNNRLKNYITNPNIDFQDKYKAQWTGDNRSFIAMTSNERVPVTVTPDTRRFLLIRANDPFEGDEARRGALYERMHTELESGGYEALMHDLLATDLSGFKVREIPQTPLFRELANLDVDRDHVAVWWRDRLERGNIGDEAATWTAPKSKDAMYSNYVEWCEANGPRAKQETLRKDQWAKRLNEMLGGQLHSRRQATGGGRREWVYVLPALEDCRAAYERHFRVTLDRSGDSATLRFVV